MLDCNGRHIIREQAHPDPELPDGDDVLVVTILAAPVFWFGAKLLIALASRVF